MDAPQYRHRPTRQNRPLEEVAAEQDRKQRKPSGGPFKLRLPKKSARYAVYGASVLLVLLIANTGFTFLPCKGVEVNLLRTAENDIVPASQIEEILAKAHGGDIAGTRMNDFDLKTLEDSLWAFRALERVALHKSLTGYLVADVTVRTPVARIMDINGTSIYIDSRGIKFPTGEYRAANVPVLRGDFEEELNDTTTLNDNLKWPANEYGCITLYETLPLLNYIHNHPFWNSQISELQLAQDGQITLYPEVGDAEIEFGLPVDIEEKLNNLMLFYKQVPKEMGWNKYRSLSVKYRGQVVGRK